MSKQDRQGVRTPANLEQKYSFGRKFSQQERVNAQYRGEISEQSGQLSSQNITMQQFINLARPVIEQLPGEVEDLEKEVGKKLSLAGGTMTGSIDMNGYQMLNLPVPTKDGHPVTKGFMTSFITEYVEEAFLNGEW